MMQTTLHRLLIGLVLVGAGVVVGGALSTTNEARGQARALLPPDTLQSGGQLSVPLLKDIAGTLQQIDARLARMEITVQKLQSPQSRSQIR